MKISKLNINSILIGLFISINALTKFITSIIELDNNIILIIGFIFFMALINNRRVSFQKDMLIVCLYILILFCISLLRLNGNEYTFIYMIKFIFYGMVGMYLISQGYIVRVIINTIYIVFFIFSICLMPLYIDQLQSGMISIDFTMDLSYTILIGIMSLVIKNLFYPPKSLLLKVINISLMIYNFYYLIFISANRGAIIALFVFFILIYYRNIKKLYIKRLILLTSILAFLLITVGFEFILGQLINLVEGMDNSIPLIYKLSSQYESSMLMSDREVIWRNAFEIFADNVLFGGGIGSLEAVYGYYAHNYILELLSELGLILALPIFYLTAYGVYLLYKSEYGTENTIFICLLFCSAIPRLFVSETLWDLPTYWMYIYLILRIVSSRNQSNFINV